MHRIFPRFVDGTPALGLLVLRIIFGTALFFHGLPKLENPLHWMDKMPNAAPPLLQALAVLFECGGGIAIALGLLTPLMAVVGLIHFATAYWTQFRGLPLVGAGGAKSAELPLLYLSVMLTMLLTGPGRISLDYLLIGKKRR